MPATIYQQSQVVPSVTISINYRPKEFLSFDITEASQGEIVWYGNEAIALRCQIRDTNYTFDRDHLDIMSQGERNLLYSHLGVEGRKLEASLV
ncbi:MAG: hypothetical protein F6K41_27455 [Symploca sp. SIO3E6]|nr:hypothetical protein [Caldora sp. SIO3E6]